MSLDKNNVDLLRWLRDVISQNRRSIFGDTHNGFRIMQLSITRPLHRKHDRYHRILKVKYSTNKGMYEKKIWLKFRNDFGKLYKIHTEIYGKLREDQKIFPRPYFYFYGQYDGSNGCVIGMEFLKGTSLRSMLLTNVAYRRIESLKKLFLAIGTGMRTFHDSSKSSGVRLVTELADNAHKVTEQTQYLTDEERNKLIRNIRNAENQANPQTELPLIKIHNDWVLRNILVDNTGAFYVVDLDSMRAPVNSRWYDLSYFFINLESQLKYWPIIDRISLLYLWKSFWQGYSQKGLPETLSENQIKAIIYLIKVEYLFGGTIRAPLFEIYNKFLGPLYLRNLKKTIMRGEYSTLSVHL